MDANKRAPVKNEKEDKPRLVCSSLLSTNDDQKTKKESKKKKCRHGNFLWPLACFSVQVVSFRMLVDFYRIIDGAVFLFLTIRFGALSKNVIEALLAKGLWLILSSFSDEKRKTNVHRRHSGRCRLHLMQRPKRRARINKNRQRCHPIKSTLHTHTHTQAQTHTHTQTHGAETLTICYLRAADRILRPLVSRYVERTTTINQKTPVKHRKTQ